MTSTRSSSQSDDLGASEIFLEFLRSAFESEPFERAIAAIKDESPDAPLIARKALQEILTTIVEQTDRVAERELLEIRERCDQLSNAISILTDQLKLMTNRTPVGQQAEVISSQSLPDGSSIIHLKCSEQETKALFRHLFFANEKMIMEENRHDDFPGAEAGGSSQNMEANESLGSSREGEHTTWPTNEVPEAITSSLEAFRRDLPKLLQEHHGEWVAYQGNNCGGFDASKTKLYRRCIEQGFVRGEFVVQRVLPDANDFEIPTPIVDAS